MLMHLIPAILQAALPRVDDARITIANEGWALVGTFRRPASAGARPAVLMLNGAARDRRAYIGLASQMADRGLASLRLDLRGEGESTNRGRFEPGQSNPALEGAERDITAALSWLRQQPGIDASRIGVVGASYSAEAMALAARTGSPASAYVAISPGSLSEESIQAIDPSGLSWWFIASRHERFAGQVVEQIPSQSRTARVTMVDGTSHASDILSPHWNLEAEIADWFAAKLGGFSAPALWGALQPGAHRVGFRRMSLPSGQRRLLVDLWYPAGGTGSELRLADYLSLSDDLRGSVPGSLAVTLAVTMTGDSGGLDPVAATRMLTSPMAAVKEPTPAPSRYPLVLWTPRYGTTVAQAVLSEMLASHGFVVAFARPEAPGRLPFELSTPAEKQAELEARVGDMATALRYLETIANVDALAVGVIAWSYTGEMATAFQMKEPAVALVAGLSTNLLSDGAFQPPGVAQALDSAKLGAAYAIITERRGVPAALSRVSGARYFVEMPGLAHGSFNALEGYWPSLLGIPSVQRWSVSGPQGIRGYEAVATIVLRLLRHHVGSRAKARMSETVLTSAIDPGVAVVIR